MPDQDIVERGMLPRWRRPYRLLKGNHPPEVVRTLSYRRSPISYELMAACLPFENYTQL